MSSREIEARLNEAMLRTRGARRIVGREISPS
jgi:hypothetical protein